MFGALGIAFIMSQTDKQKFDRECDWMGKAIVSSVIAIIVGYFGSGIGDAVMNWPQLGPILAIVVMGSAIISSLEKDK